LAVALQRRKQHETSKSISKRAGVYPQGEHHAIAQITAGGVNSKTRNGVSATTRCTNIRKHSQSTTDVFLRNFQAKKGFQSVKRQKALVPVGL